MPKLHTHNVCSCTIHTYSCWHSPCKRVQLHKYAKQISHTRKHSWSTHSWYIHSPFVPYPQFPMGVKGSRVVRVGAPKKRFKPQIRFSRPDCSALRPLKYVPYTLNIILSLRHEAWRLVVELWQLGWGWNIEQFEARRDTIVNPSSMYICTKNLIFHTIGRANINWPA